jgi:hypothetical protein
MTPTEPIEQIRGQNENPQPHSARRAIGGIQTTAGRSDHGTAHHPHYSPAHSGRAADSAFASDCFGARNYGARPDRRRRARRRETVLGSRECGRAGGRCSALTLAPSMDYGIRLPNPFNKRSRLEPSPSGRRPRRSPICSPSQSRRVGAPQGPTLTGLRRLRSRWRPRYRRSGQAVTASAWPL